MERQLSEVYEFGNFRFNPTERYLLLNGESVPLTPKAFDTLFALVSRSGHLVTKEDLLKEVWQDAFVEEATVVQNISTLRKVLSRDGADNIFIETIPKRGYRFVANVITCDENSSQPVSTRLTTDIANVAVNHGNGDRLGAESESPKVELSESAAATVSKPIERSGRIATWKSASYIVLGLLTLTAGGLLVARNVRQNRLNHDRTAPFERMSLVRITQTGNARNSAISPDGKYVAYVALEAGKQSLWVRQVGTLNDAQIIPPLEARFLGLTFSTDGRYVFFVTYEKAKNEGVLYRIPVIGGSPQRVLNDIDSPVTFSPDGKQLAFVRGYPASHETSLIVAQVDGTDERKLASRVFPAFFSSTGPAWSPNGLLIACGVRSPDPRGISETVVGVEPISQKEERLTEQRWVEVGRLSWNKGGELIILDAAQEQGLHQLWQISLPSGLAHRITNDLTNYQGVSLTSDVSALSTVEVEANSSIWVTSGPPHKGTELASTRNDGLAGIAWTPDGKLVFASGVGLQTDIWTADADGGRKIAITNDSRRDSAPVVTPDGHFLIYSSSEASKPAKIWRTNIDGSNPKQLTFGNDDRFPSCSLDGKWIFYSSVDYNEPKDTYDEMLWKVSIDGGERSLVFNQPASRPLVSPDGRLIAFRYQATSNLPWTLRVIKYGSGEVVKDLPAALFPRWITIQWAPNSRSLSYVVTREGVSNIWTQPLDGGAPKQVTHFDSGEIFRYAWSTDGKRLAVVRGVLNSDVVLIRDFG